METGPTGHSVTKVQPTNQQFLSDPAMAEVKASTAFGLRVTVPGRNANMDQSTGGWCRKKIDQEGLGQCWHYWPRIQLPSPGRKSFS